MLYAAQWACESSGRFLPFAILVKVNEWFQSASESLLDSLLRQVLLVRKQVLRRFEFHGLDNGQPCLLSCVLSVLVFSSRYFA